MLNIENAKIATPKVVLLSHTPNPEELIYTAARQCYSAMTGEDIQKQIAEGSVSKEKIDELLRRVIFSGHTSVAEHATFTFSISGVSRACYDDQTEVLTERGWKLFRDLLPYDKVRTKCINTGSEQFQNYYNVTAYKYSGKLHHYKSQCVDLAVTPNHSMVLKKYDTRVPSKYEFIKSEDIDFKRFYVNKTIVHDTPSVKDLNIEIQPYVYTRFTSTRQLIEKETESFNTTRHNFAMFLAWYLSEGSVWYDKTEQKYIISIAQEDSEKNERNRERICEIIRSMGLTPVCSKKRIAITGSRSLGRFLSTLGKSFNKKFPFEKLFNFFDRDLARDFINEYALADGHVDKNGNTKLYSSSKILIDQLQIIAGIAGVASNIYVDLRDIDIPVVHPNVSNPIIKNWPCYNLSIGIGQRNQEPVIKTDAHKRDIQYNGYVYCVEVPEHTLYVRRNGKACWCGNCSHQFVRHRIASHSQQSQRYVDSSNFKSVIPFRIKSSEKATALYLKHADECNRVYNELIDILVEEGHDAGKCAEDARYALHSGIETKIIATFNARSLFNFFAHRCCMRAMNETRKVADMMLKLVTDIAPTLFETIGAPCEFSGFCPELEKFSCGRYPSIHSDPVKSAMSAACKNFI